MSNQKSKIEKIVWKLSVEEFIELGELIGNIVCVEVSTIATAKKGFHDVSTRSGPPFIEKRLCEQSVRKKERGRE